MTLFHIFHFRLLRNYDISIELFLKIRCKFVLLWGCVYLLTNQHRRHLLRSFRFVQWSLPFLIFCLFFGNFLLTIPSLVFFNHCLCQFWLESVSSIGSSRLWITFFVNVFLFLEFWRNYACKIVSQLKFSHLHFHLFSRFLHIGELLLNLSLLVLLVIHLCFWLTFTPVGSQDGY